MHDALRAKLDSLSPLSQANPSEECKVCGSAAILFDVVDFYKYCSHSPYEYGVSGIYVEYFRCDNCGYLFTSTFDDWSEPDFAKYIYNDDYIKVDSRYDGSRAYDNAKVLSKIFGQTNNARILDYGSGRGCLGDALRPSGFSVSSYDPYSSPSPPEGKFDIVVLMEVIEHTPAPIQTLRSVLDLLAEDGLILIGQTLQPDDINHIRGSWWYLGPRNGHISTYSERTFMKLAEQFGLRYYRGGALYCFVRGAPPEDLMTVTKYFIPLKRVSLVSDSQLLDGEFIGCSHGDFHGYEKGEFGSYRWSGGTSYTWILPPDDENASTVELPFCMSITEDYTNRCEVSVDGQPTAIAVVMGRIGGTLKFDVSPSAHAREVRLSMPQPRSPRELFGAEDDRPLGLAIMTRGNYNR